MGNQKEYWNVNMSRKEAAAKIAEKLNKVMFLFDARISNIPRGKCLCIKFDDLNLEYTEKTSNGMMLFLNQLNSMIRDKSLVAELINNLNIIDLEGKIEC
ncbi:MULTISPECIES: hypothetical protein [Bacillus amyloliquefaciens group]|uniref:Uncharacterized protein n=1 Tax=Bacillus velezensis TaxID=492670 RepID=A0ABC8DFF5_BACVE|nr:MULTISPECIES: hypothetical protein [Bacillus amyloliquefaciens group]AVI31020.1 hypothetical protein C3Z10_21730 [Bacillus velezensis]AWX74654.1 hypothetical protein BVDSYZ_21660 [Bacillus velezensis]MDK2561854.1 hypothetical protein [Bacillus amyloliquefaciens]